MPRAAYGVLHRARAGALKLQAMVMNPIPILVAAHIFGEEMHRMVDEPERRREIDKSLMDVYRDLAIAPAACSVKAALNLLGHPVGGLRLPLVEASERERSAVRAFTSLALKWICIWAGSRPICWMVKVSRTSETPIASETC